MNSIQYAVTDMKMLIPAFLAFFLQSGVHREVVTLSFDAKDFREAFNAAADRPRLVGVFSPTCGHCLQACSELQEILNQNPKARLAVFLMWAPFMQRDTLILAQRATGYLPDRRVKHYWDLWKYAARTYEAQLKVPKGHAWDMFVFYKPHLVWENSLPEPTFWLQNRGLKVGVPYTQEDLQAGLEEWLD
jgi:thiol-disulfide isomerase/thioredoxin